MKFGAIVGITAGVGVGSGLFAAAGLSLLISAFIGAAVAIDPNYGLASKERHRNRGLFRLHGIGNQNRKNMN